MSIHEPPIQPDDTQPSASRATQPRRPAKRRALLPPWALLLLMLLSGVSLVATLAFAMQRGQQPVGDALFRVTLVVAGSERIVQSQATTVGELLQEQGVSLSEADAVAPSLQTPLRADLVVTVDRARDVWLIVGGERRMIQTPLTNPQAILDSAGIVLEPRDEVWVDGTLAEHSRLPDWPVPADEIEVRQAVTLTIVDGDDEITLDSSAATVGDALYEAGIVLYLTDEVTPDVGTPLQDGMQIVIDRAQPVRIEVDGTVIETRVQGGTVADALTEAGIALVGLDYTMPAERATLQPGETIRVLRVTERIESVQEPIPYETHYQSDSSLELDQRQVVQAGQAGVLQTDERVRYENGIEVGREPAGSRVVEAPVDQIIAYGTNIVVRTLQTPDGPIEYWRKTRVYATSYHPAALGGDNITAIGETLRHGIIGADPTIIPYRTDLYVPGYGLGFVADTGGARSSPFWVDLGYSDEDYVSWHRYVDVYWLTPVPESIDYLLPDWRPMRGLPDG